MPGKGKKKKNKNNNPANRLPLGSAATPNPEAPDTSEPALEPAAGGVEDEATVVPVRTAPSV